MPSLKGSAKVDCQNAIVDIYQILDEDDQMQVDSASPYATLAFNGAKKIGYKRGMGYACLKMAYIGILEGIVNNDDIIKAPGFIDKIENQINQAKQIGGELNDDAMTGSSYYLLSMLQNLMKMKEQRKNNHGNL